MSSVRQIVLISWQTSAHYNLLAGLFWYCDELELITSRWIERVLNFKFNANSHVKTEAITVKVLVLLVQARFFVCFFLTANLGIFSADSSYSALIPFHWYIFFSNSIHFFIYICSTGTCNTVCVRVCAHLVPVDASPTYVTCGCVVQDASCTLLCYVDVQWNLWIATLWNEDILWNKDASSGLNCCSQCKWHPEMRTPLN
jgi:hypothetical protein